MRYGVIRPGLRIAAVAAFLWTVVLSVSAPTVSAQTYVFGRADFATGNGPVAVALGDFNNDGILDAAIVNEADNTVSIILGGDGSFGTRLDYPVGKSPSALAAADFNGDGKLDLAVTNAGDGTVSVLLGNGDGTFQSVAMYSVGKTPSSVAVGDFKGDKKPDLAVANNTDNTVSILIGKGDGTFDSPVSYAAGKAPTAVITADFRGDGKLDLVVAGAGASILLGNGDGTFASETTMLSGPGPESVATGDLNADGKLDLVITDSTASTASILLGNGDGTFSLFFAYATGASPAAVAIADMNGDSLPDIATANQSGSLSVFIQDTFVQMGTTYLNFAPHVDYALNGSLSSLVVADFNGDGKLDFGVTNLSSNALSAVLGRGDGTFELRNDYVFGSRPYDISDGDFTNDGKLDLLVGAPYFGGLFTFLGNGDGTFQTPLLGFNTSGNVATPGDFNGDGKLDAVYNIFGSLSIVLGNGDGTFTLAGTVTGSFGTPAVGDFNGDGKLDVAAAEASTNSVAVMLGNGDGTLQAAVTYATGVGAATIAVADFNGDGVLDLAVTDVNCPSSPCSPGFVSILLGNGDGTFKPHVEYPVGTNPLAIATDDFNKDGKIDLAVANQTDGTISILLGNGDGTFQGQVTYPEPNAGQLAVADFNSDGVPDLAAIDQAYCNYPPSTTGIVSVLFGKGDGTFQPHTDYASPACPVALTSGDFNGDGAPDLAVLEDQGAEEPTYVSVLLDGPFVALFPTALTFSSQSVGSTSAPQSVRIFNPGAGQLTVTNVITSGDFLQTNNCPSALASRASCDVTVTFAPSTSGSRSGTLTITDNAATSPQSIALTGTGGAEVSITPSSLTFGLQSVGTISAPQVVTLTNTSGIELNFFGATIAGADSGDFIFCAPMVVPNAPCFYPSFGDCSITSVLEPGGYCTVGIGFDPMAGGNRSATLSFSDSAPGSPQTVPLSGVAPLPVVSLSPSSLTFGDQPVGTASPVKTVTLTNTGDAALAISSITASGGYVATTTCRSPISVGAKCLISVIFKPSAAGTIAGTVSISDNAANTPQVLALTGTATAPGVSLSPRSLSFGSELAGQSLVATPVLLTNTGSAPLAITSIALGGTDPGDFSQQNNCGTTVVAGATCTIDVTFKPTAGGSRSATLSVTDNAPASPQTLTLSGTGQDFALAPVGASSATVTAGGTATYDVQAAGSGGFTGNVSLACSGAPAASTCTVGPSGILVPVGGSPVAKITVTTTAASLAPRPLRPFDHRPLGSMPWIIGAPVLAICIVLLRRRRLTNQRAWAPATVLIIVVAIGATISACGGSSNPTSQNTGTPAGTYKLTVTGTYAAGAVSLQNSVTLTLTVQ